MSSQSPYRAPESPQWQNQPQVVTSPGSGQSPLPLPSAGVPQQPGYAAQQPYPPIPLQPVMYQFVPQNSGYSVAAAVPQQANGPGIASLVLGIIGVVTCWFFLVGLPVSLLGLALAIVGMRRIQGKGMAKAGLVLSIIGAAIAGVLTVLFIIETVIPR